MALKKVISAQDAVALIRDGDVVASSGYGGNGNPETLFKAIEQRFLAGNGPSNITLLWAGGQGDGQERGLNRLGHVGLLKRTIGGHYGLIPRIEALAVANKIEAYNFPQGVICQLMRDIAAGRPGCITYPCFSRCARSKLRLSEIGHGLALSSGFERSPRELSSWFGA